MSRTPSLIRSLVLVTALFLSGVQVVSLLHANQHELASKEFKCLAHINSQHFSNGITADYSFDCLPLAEDSIQNNPDTAVLPASPQTISCRGPPHIA